MVTENSCVFLYIPDTLENNNVGYLCGYIDKSGQELKFFITDNKLKNNRINCIGFCGLSNLECTEDRVDDWIHINFSYGKFQLVRILCNGVQDSTQKSICVFYDHNSFRRSDVMLLRSKHYGDDFIYLSKILNNSDRHSSDVVPSDLTRIWHKIVNFMLQCNDSIFEVCKKNVHILGCSSTLLHIVNSVHQTHHIFENVVSKRRPSLEVYNIVVSRLFDFIVGMLILNWLWQHEHGVSYVVNDSAQEIITSLRGLLNFLMGSPVGLKLNNAFNNTLGNFFIYHIALWRTFLMVTSPLMGTVAAVMYGIAALGFTFQVALVTDMFALATFHVYCIYVYAARLYSVQVNGLISLWRLFLGRKHNPLKNRVDSYHYTNHQLFVGTLAFSILLFLLPTTALYYLVFITLRLMLLVTSILLERSRRAVLSLPLYMTYLWLTNSPRIRGDIHIEAATTDVKEQLLCVHATLRAGSWWDSCNMATPPQPSAPNGAALKTTTLERCSWPGLLNTVAMGHLV